MSDKEIVKFAVQPNEISRSNFLCSTSEYRVIIYALYKSLQDENPIEPDKPNPYFAFSCKEFCKQMGLNYHSKKTYETMSIAVGNLTKKVVQLQRKDLEGRNIKSFFTFFSHIDILPSGYINIKFNPDLLELMNNKNFSKLNLLEFGSLNSFYSQRFYGLAKSTAGFAGANGNKKNEWYFEYTETEIRKLFEIDEKDYSGRRNNFVTFVIKKPCKEVSEKTEVKITPQSRKIDKGEYVWTFFCSSDETEKEQSDGIPKKSVKTLEYEFFAKHHDDYDRFYKIAENMGDEFCTVEKVRQSVINSHSDEWRQIHA